MDSSSQAKLLFETTKQFHTSLIQRAREIAKVRDILEFVVECVSFAETYFPASAISSWKDGPLHLNELSKRTESIRALPISDLEYPFPNLVNTSGSAATSVFSMLNDNFRFLEDNETRTLFGGLTVKYRILLSGHWQVSPKNGSNWAESRRARLSQRGSKSVGVGKER
jgi:hypothetical protein